jgi:hypothetical protein
MPPVSIPLIWKISLFHGCVAGLGYGEDVGCLVDRPGMSAGFCGPK